MQAKLAWLRLGAGVTLALACAGASAAAFTAGNIVVYRVGTGSGSLVNTGNAVFVDEYTSGGALVQSVALPTSTSGASVALIASGTATSEGMLSRSADGQYLIATGYGRAVGGSGSLSGTASAIVPRVVGRIDFNGAVDTTTALTDYADGNNPRSATSSDGNALWMTGGAGGVRFATLGSTTSTQLSTTQTNLRQASIFASQLYVDTGSGATKAVGSVGSGLPTTSGQTINYLAGLPASGSPYAFVALDLDATVAGVDTLYVADDSIGLEKFSLVGTTWTANGTVGIATDAYRGLTATVAGGTVTLYAVRKGGANATGGGELVTLADASGYNGAFSGSPTLLATAAANTAFRGVTLAPVQIPVTPPSVTGLPGAFSGVIGDATDYASTLGIAFTVSDAVTAACSVGIAVSSSNTSVVPNANLALGACNNGAYTLKIAPAAVGFSDITITATNAGNLVTTSTLHFAASAPWVAPGALATIWTLGSADASTAQVIDPYTTVIGDDENQVLRVYSRQDSGPPLVGFDVTSSLELTDPSDLEVDIEASIKDSLLPNRIYWQSSHGNSKKGNLKPNRNRIFATDLTTSVSGDRVTVTALGVVGYYEHLRDDLIAWDQSNGHGLGANYLGFAASAAAGRIPKEPDGSGFNLEGLTLSPDGSVMWAGFRAPLLPTNARTQALLVPVLNYQMLANGSLGHTTGQASFGAPIFLDLGGRGVREIRCTSTGCLIEAGSVDGTPNPALYTWSGNAADNPVLRSGNVAGLNPEGVIELPAGGLADNSVLEIVSDEGSAVYYADGTEAKDLTFDNWQKFRIDQVTLGARTPAHIAANGTTSQSTLVNTAFANPLAVLVSDTNHAPIAGVAVTFAAPTHDASAVFSSNSSTSEIVHTDASGVATSSALTANSVSGNFSVSAGLATGAFASINLSNLAPAASFSTSALAFGSVDYGSSTTQPLNISNTGSSALHITQASTDGDFTISASTCADPVAPQSSCTLTITFQPTAFGARAGTLTIASDSLTDPGSVALSGTGATAQIALHLAVDDGKSLLQPGEALTYTITLTNTGPDRASAVALTDAFPSALTNCTWTSTASNGATGNTAGPVSGNIGETLDLPASSGVTYTVNCTVAANAAAGPLANAATVGVSSLFTNSADSSATDSDEIVTDVIFRDSFE